jgi:transposase
MNHGEGPRGRRIAELEARVRELEAQLAAALKLNEILLARLGLNSSNSSKPPSSDSPRTPKTTKRRGKGRKRKRGGQKGHPRHPRNMVPPKDVTRTVEHRPDECAHCDEPLSEKDCDSTPTTRHQIVELPEIKPDVEEHQCFSATCGTCGWVTEAVLPDEVQRDVFGPRLKALVGMLGGKYRISKRGMVELLADLLHINVALGSVPKMEKFVSAALAASHEEVRAHVQSSSESHADETSWRENKKKAWLWVASTAQAVLFCIAIGRGKVHAKDLLGEKYSGIVHTDRWRGYDWIDVERRQLCWSHLDRNFQGVVDRGGPGKRFGRAMLKSADTLFSQWHKYRMGKIQARTFRRRMERLRKRVRGRLKRYSTSGIDHVESMCRDLLRLEPAMWTFVYEAGVVPTNNTAERDIRKGVMWRKVSFGTDSEAGSRFAERILTASETCRKQERNLFSFLTQSCEAFQAGDSLPPLLPA